MAAGLTVTELASRLGVTPSAVSQLERSEAEGTIKLNSLREALGAMDARLLLTVAGQNRMSRYAPHQVADSLAYSLVHDRDTAFALRLLTHATKELSDNYDRFDPTDIEYAPTALPDIRWDTLMRALYREAIPGARKPAWTVTKKLAAPWFVSEYAILRERAAQSTPPYLRRLNIFIDANSLRRA